jgi:N-acetylglucosaminyl-diphospho-decaprenol L-rhamnosyltransferase
MSTSGHSYDGGIDVAVAIVSYRSAALTIDCLRSIAAERSTPGIRIRTIVVDNASGDAPAIAEAIETNAWTPWVTLVRAPRNGGFAYGNNLAFRRARDIRRPAYFHLLNPDTVVRQGAIGALVRFLETHPEAGVAGGSFENLDGSDWPFAFRFPSILSEVEGGLQLSFATRLLRRWVITVGVGSTPQPVDWLPGASMMIRGSVYETMGGFDESYFLYFEETDFCYRARQAGFDTWHVPDSRVMHIAGQSTKVTERNVPAKRLPSYWFESRRRYFVSSYGMAYALAVDLAAILAYAFGSVKRFVQRRRDRGVPHFLSDLAYHSPLRTKNRGGAIAKPRFLAEAARKCEPARSPSPVIELSPDNVHSAG